MSSTGDHIKESVVWTWGQVRLALLIQTFAGLLVALCVGFGSYWYASYKDISVRLDERLPAFEESVDTWITETAKTFSEANSNLSDQAKLSSREDLLQIQENVTKLISQLNTIPTPTQNIENAATNFRVSLSNIIREIGRYDNTPEALTRIVIANNDAALVGGTHKQEIEDYLGSTISRLLGSL
jgi:hypothetical protein